MITRTKDFDYFLETMDEHLPIYGLMPEDWLSDDRNIALSDGIGNFGLFEYELDGVYSGHYFFKSARGRAAVTLAKTIISEVFSQRHGIVEVVRGLTPLTRLGARWINRQIGIPSYGVVNTLIGPCELVIMNRLEWENK